MIFVSTRQNIANDSKIYRAGIRHLGKANNDMKFAVLVIQVCLVKRNLDKKLEDISIPLGKDILEEVQFKEEVTRSRCRGWLVLPSRRYLQADILFPGSEFDCRLTIRGQTGMIWHELLCIS